MGRRVHLFQCLDCKDKYGGDPDIDRKKIRNGFHQPDHFFVKMEHMTKQELLKHLEDVECPVCESDNWKITDYSTI